LAGNHARSGHVAGGHTLHRHYEEYRPGVGWSARGTNTKGRAPFRGRAGREAALVTRRSHAPDASGRPASATAPDTAFPGAGTISTPRRDTSAPRSVSQRAQPDGPGPMSDAEQMMPSRWQNESEGLLRVVERMALILNEAGIPRMPARVLAYTLADDADRYSAAALADGLRVSPAAISGAVRHLTATRMVVKEREPGKRADLYRVREGDVCGMIVAAWIPVLKQWESVLETATVEVGAQGGGGRRLAEATTFIAFPAQRDGGLARALGRVPPTSSVIEAPPGIRGPSRSGLAVDRSGGARPPRRAATAFGSGCPSRVNCGPRCFVGRWLRPAG